MDKIYLGDSVYVEKENDMLKLTTDNGTNTIYMEGQVLVNLLDYLQTNDIIKWELKK